MPGPRVADRRYPDRSIPSRSHLADCCCWRIVLVRGTYHRAGGAHLPPAPALLPGPGIVLGFPLHSDVDGLAVDHRLADDPRAWRPGAVRRHPLLDVRHATVDPDAFLCAV